MIAFWILQNQCIEGENRFEFFFVLMIYYHRTDLQINRETAENLLESYIFAIFDKMKDSQNISVIITSTIY